MCPGLPLVLVVLVERKGYLRVWDLLQSLLGLPAVSPGHDSASGSGLTSPLLGNANGRATKKASTIEGKYWVPADEAERRAASESGRGRTAASAVPDVQAQGTHTGKRQPSA
jgi:hypothetical protein